MSTKRELLKREHDVAKEKYGQAAEKAEAAWVIAHNKKIKAYQKYVADKSEASAAAYEAAKRDEKKAHDEVVRTKGVITDAFNTFVQSGE